MRLRADPNNHKYLILSSIYHQIDAVQNSRASDIDRQRLEKSLIAPDVLVQAKEPKFLR